MATWSRRSTPPLMASALRSIIVAVLLAPATSGTNEFGKSFLAKMRNEPGVIELPSGLMYRVLREGDGEVHPLANTQCSCHERCLDPTAPLERTKL